MVKGKDTRLNPHRKFNTGDTKFAQWLRDHPELIQQDVADKIRELRGWGCGQNQIYQWAAGVVIPSRMSRYWISRATGGEVSPEDWGDGDE